MTTGVSEMGRRRTAPLRRPCSTSTEHVCSDALRSEAASKPDVLASLIAPVCRRGRRRIARSRRIAGRCGHARGSIEEATTASQARVAGSGRCRARVFPLGHVAAHVIELAISSQTAGELRNHAGVSARCRGVVQIRARRRKTSVTVWVMARSCPRARSKPLALGGVCERRRGNGGAANRSAQTLACPLAVALGIAPVDARHGQLRAHFVLKDGTCPLTTIRGRHE
jgi:hypothetical protein